MYEDEARVMTERDKAKIQAAEMTFMRSTLGCTILDRKKNVNYKDRTGGRPIFGTGKE